MLSLQVGKQAGKRFLIDFERQFALFVMLEARYLEQGQVNSRTHRLGKMMVFLADLLPFEHGFPVHVQRKEILEIHS